MMRKDAKHRKRKQASSEGPREVDKKTITLEKRKATTGPTKRRSHTMGSKETASWSIPPTLGSIPSTTQSRKPVKPNASTEKLFSNDTLAKKIRTRMPFPDSQEGTSPIRTSSPNRLDDMYSVSPNPEWDNHEHASRMEHDILHGNLSMDSSLTSTSSFDQDELTPAMSGKPNIPLPRYKTLLWQWSRPRAIMLLLSFLGMVFMSITTLLSIAIHLPLPPSSEEALRASLLPRRGGGGVRLGRPATLSLTSLAQGPPTELYASNSNRTRKEYNGTPFVPKYRSAFPRVSVKTPDDWRADHGYASLELRTYHDTSITSSQRMAFLQDPRLSASHPASRKVTQYPPDFTDPTQLYSMLDSHDERVKGMELREPYVDRDCVPMADWQTTFHPSCNAVHELGLANIGSSPAETEFDLFGKKGFWRNAWKVETKHGKDVFVLKTLKIRHNFEEAHFEHDRIDAVAMERLSGSPHVIDIFGFCGHSVMTEYANGKRLGAVADQARKTPLARLQMATDIAKGLADVHGIDGEDRVSFVHLDVNPANVVIVGDKLKLNDFNIGIIRRWNTTSNQACGFPAQYPNPQWRSPEEARNENNLTEKVDIFSLGHIFYRLISGAEPWNRLEPGGKPSKEEVNEKVRQGILPTFPDFVVHTTDPEIIAIRKAMLKCYEKNPNDRPSAREIARFLDTELLRLKSFVRTNK